MRGSIFVSLCTYTCTLAIGGSLVHPAYAADEATVAWLRDGQVSVRSLTANGSVAAGREAATQKVPLGSLWKLFVFAYLAERQIEEPAYVCADKRATPSSEEHYCCEPGESVSRGPALARSCAPYYAPTRLHISAADWRNHWKARLDKNASTSWLLALERLTPDTELPLESLLQTLALITPQARAEARRALLETGVEGYGRGAWIQLGSGVRYKTFTWHREKGIAFGGAAGWLADGTPFWFGARGSSRSALTTWAAPLAAALPALRWPNQEAVDDAEKSCVDVDFFARYGLRAVWHKNEAVQAKAGTLNGSYRLEFRNGNWLTITSRGQLSLSVDPAPSISGRFTLNDYIARVIDREGNAAHVQSARALAIAARSYLLQNARFENGCWHIEDSSRTQRVSPNPPSEAARAAAWFTDEIVLKGVPVQYHRDRAGVNQLAWHDAVTQEKAKRDFEQILSAAYPKASLGALNGREECVRMEAAEAWLGQAAPNWQKYLRAEPGYETLGQPVKVCTLTDSAHPFSDQLRLRIYARGWRSLDERTTLAHEYLHLAFRFHPNGSDEAYIERLARRLMGS